MTAPTITGFVALGDSFTAGTGCLPGESWADRLAAALRSGHPELAYRNFARDGATSGEVLEQQIGPALQLEPDLAVVICGANDVIRSVRPDADGFGERYAEILDRLRDALPGGLIATATQPEEWRFLELRPRTRRRILDGLRAINERTRTIAAEREIPCLDVAGHPGLDDRENFSADGLHPSALGHARAAAAFERLLRDRLAATELRTEEAS